MLKVDLRKAYDSIEWSYLQTVLYELGFPQRFVDWIMACVSTVSYSILLNGKPCPPIPAKKGLRQGAKLQVDRRGSEEPFLFALGMEYLSRCLGALAHNPNFNYHPKCEKLHISHVMFADDLLMFARGDKESIRLLLEAFHKFSASSGLTANLDKSNLYLSRVNSTEVQEILDMAQIPIGDLPFKYLGVPLTSRKLTYGECKPLVEKMTTRVRNWASKSLSYAGRIQLVKSVLQGIQSYWSQIFLLPKKVLREIKKVCITFLWTGTDSTSKKAPVVAWEQLCLPKSAGGWNILDVENWNQAAITKFYWSIALKKEKLWIKWIHTYYIKNKDIWTMPIPNGISWNMKKILESRKHLDANSLNQFTAKSGKFSIKKLYKHIIGESVNVPWKRLICNNIASPKSKFILWLAVLGRLATKDRLAQRNVTQDAQCILCNAAVETVDHLFCHCPSTLQVWTALFDLLHIQRQLRDFKEEVHYACAAARRKSASAKAFVMCFTEAVSHIWCNRNACIFRGNTFQASQIVRTVIFCVTSRCDGSIRELLSS